MIIKIEIDGNPYSDQKIKKRFEEREKKMKEKGTTYEYEVKRIFENIGIDLETELIEYY